MSELAFKERVEKIKEFDKDLDWLNKRLETLRKKYGGKYVAIKHSRIISSDDDRKRLLKRLRDKKYDTHRMVIKRIGNRKVLYAV